MGRRKTPRLGGYAGGVDGSAAAAVSSSWGELIGGERAKALAPYTQDVGDDFLGDGGVDLGGDDEDESEMRHFANVKHAFELYECDALREVEADKSKYATVVGRRRRIAPARDDRREDSEVEAGRRGPTRPSSTSC